jgi:hypothetical protein
MDWLGVSEYQKNVFTRRPSELKVLPLFQTDYAPERTRRNLMF